VPLGPLAEPGPSARRAGRRFLADVRSGRAFLAAELSQPGWLDFGAFRWRDLAVSQSVRTTIGVLTPLVIGVATGRIEYGSYAALGALPAGFVSFRGVSWTRVLAVLFAAAGMAVSTFAGATAAHGQPWLLVPIVCAWGYASGLLASLGPTVLAVTLQWPIALLIASALPLGPGSAAIRAGLVFGGGLWQSLLVVSSWAVSRGNAERTAVADSYRALARYATELAAGQYGPPAPAQLPGTYVLMDPNPLIRTAARANMDDLAEEAERIRATVTALSIGRKGSDPGSAGRTVLTGTARVLDELADSVTARPRAREDCLAAARSALDGINAEAGTTWQWAGEALLGQLRSAVRIASRLAAAESRPARKAGPRRLRRDWASEAMLTLRASLTTSSESGRHALRLALVAAIAEIIAQATDLPHGYWIVLTIFIVLRPDYSSTLYRGLQRAAGTAVGAGLGVATVLLAKVSLGALIAGIAVSLLAAYAVFTVNYLLYAVFLTDFVVILLDLLGLPPDPTAVARLIGTGIGTGLAIIAYLVWPTWEGTSAGEKFARLITTQSRYASALLRAYGRPRDARTARLRGLQLTARRARIDAEASADRLAGEPRHPPMSPETARALESVGHRFAQAGLTLRAVVSAQQAGARREQRDAVPPQPESDLQPDLDKLADGFDEAADVLADWLRHLGSHQHAGDVLPSLPQLRPRLQAMWTAHPDSAPAESGEHGQRKADDVEVPAVSARGERGGLFAAADSLVDAINTAAHVLRS
jgi:uncharacterized membrane protein YccC